MQRDFETYAKWENWHKEQALKDFESKKAKALKDAIAENSKTLINRVEKMKFIFEKQGLLQYGNCLKLNKPVSFIPDTCTPENKDCFLHRKD